MGLNEAREWLNGNRSTVNTVPEEPRETWQERIARADASYIEMAYWILRAHKEGLVDNREV